MDAAWALVQTRRELDHIGARPSIQQAPIKAGLPDPVSLNLYQRCCSGTTQQSSYDRVLARCGAAAFALSKAAQVVDCLDPTPYWARRLYELQAIHLTALQGHS